MHYICYNICKYVFFQCFFLHVYYVFLFTEVFMFDSRTASSAALAYLGDAVLEDFVMGRVDWSVLREHIKVEEQKWIRKAKRYQLYEEPLWRIKSLG